MPAEKESSALLHCSVCSKAHELKQLLGIVGFKCKSRGVPAGTTDALAMKSEALGKALPLPHQIDQGDSVTPLDDCTSCNQNKVQNR